MSTILLFPKREGPPLPAQRRPQSAEILFFLGVRYERAASAQSEEALPRRSAPATRKASANPRRRTKRSA